MSVAVVYSRGLAGLEAPLVRVEAHMGNGLPCFHIVGLPETEVKEARDRVRAALANAGFDFPQRRITINLAPADLPKASGRFDLPIAIGVLAASGQVPARALEQLELAGELGLAGDLRPIHGALAMTFGARRAGRAFILPACVAHEAALARSAKVFPAATLTQVCEHLTGITPLRPFEAAPLREPAPHPDLADVRGQAQARRALEIAAAGGHSMLFTGPPGTGKTMLAMRLPGILPEMHEDEALEAAAVQSLASGVFDPRRFGSRPFRAPHHTASAIALVGGSSPPRPGEISLAHHGVLFLDELPEFARAVLEVLREPLESGRITISRAARQAEFPAAFQLIAAMNPCPCGYRGDTVRVCRCDDAKVQRYRARISGPLLDRIDLHIEVPQLPSDALDGEPGEPSARVRARVTAARAGQLARQGCANARIASHDIDERVRMTPAARLLLREAAAKAMLSARARHRVMKVARTIADLSGSAQVDIPAMAEALTYRSERPPG